MKRTISGILFGLLFLIGLGVLIYPTVSNQWNTYRQSKLISNYQEVVKEMKEQDFTDEWILARSFNDTIKYDALYSDAFGTSDTDMTETEYWRVLNVARDGVMGYLSIPKVKVKLAIYHGTEETVLQTGIGHINGTKLPIGGVSTHCVLSGHRGLPTAKLFTDLDQMQPGDVFYIHVLDETFAYQVDQISDMVDKNDAEALSAALAVEEGEDYVTLFTCTPYGVNTHRLLVRGSRIPYVEEEEPVVSTVPEAMLESVQNYYMIYMILGLSATVLGIIIIRVIFRIRRKSQIQK